MSIRYMGTKRHLAGRVAELIGSVAPRRRAVVDLFSGTGSVAEALVGIRPVVTNDALEFTTVIARVRFTDIGPFLDAGAAINQLREPYREQLRFLSEHFGGRLRGEGAALNGNASALLDYMLGAKHAGNSPSARRDAQAASATPTGSPARYSLTTLYFSAGYFSLRQAMQLDSLRYAIDRCAVPGRRRRWMLAAWLITAATVVNAPGHTAQFLKPNSEAAYARIRRCWRRSIWDEFQDTLIGLAPVGPTEWRRTNRAHHEDALRWLSSSNTDGVGLVYADPPYTKDQYSRYYHVYETMLKYDFPDSTGEGRVRSDRFTTPFSLKSGVVSAFEDLFGRIADLGVVLVLSYPSSGLLHAAGATIRDVLSPGLKITGHQRVPAEHSTLGASNGERTKTATENIYVCQPR